MNLINNLLAAAALALAVGAVRSVACVFTLNGAQRALAARLFAHA